MQCSPQASSAECPLCLHCQFKGNQLMWSQTPSKPRPPNPALIAIWGELWNVHFNIFLWYLYNTSLKFSHKCQSCTRDSPQLLSYNYTCHSTLLAMHMTFVIPHIATVLLESFQNMRALNMLFVHSCHFVWKFHLYFMFFKTCIAS